DPCERGTRMCPSPQRGIGRLSALSLVLCVTLAGSRLHCCRDTGLLEARRPVRDGAGEARPLSRASELVLRLPDRNDVREGAFAPNGRTLATATRGTELPLWDVGTGKSRILRLAGID